MAKYLMNRTVRRIGQMGWELNTLLLLLPNPNSPAHFSNTRGCKFPPFVRREREREVNLKPPLTLLYQKLYFTKTLVLLLLILLLWLIRSAPPNFHAGAGMQGPPLSIPLSNFLLVLKAHQLLFLSFHLSSKQPAFFLLSSLWANGFCSNSRQVRSIYCLGQRGRQLRAVQDSVWLAWFNSTTLLLKK